ncbi:MAG: SdrD B-like domain-containing protein [Bacteroidota bacterium]
MKHSVHLDGSLRLVYTYVLSAILSFTFLFTASPILAQSALLTRSVSNTHHCNNGITYGFWLDLDGYNNYYKIHDASFVEFDNGTANLTGTIKNKNNEHLQFTVDVTLSGRTYVAPSGSPKANECGTEDASEWYYYTSTSGILTGADRFSGASIEIGRMGEAFQVGNGANVTGDAHKYSGSGWLTLNITSQPSNSNYHLNGHRGDINIMLGGEGCDNLTSGGLIGSTQCNSEPFDAEVIQNIVSPSGGNTQAIEYVWLTTTDPELPMEQWTEIAGATSDSYDPGLITETTYFLRCARRFPCKYFYGESNVVAKIIQPNPFNGSCITGIIKSEKGSGKAFSNNHGVDHPNNLLGKIDDIGAQLYDNNDNITIELDSELKAGETYTVSWKYRYYNSSYSGPAQIEVFESENGVDFTYRTTLSTNSIYFYVHQNITAGINTRFIKLNKKANTPDSDVDAITYTRKFCQEPTICKLNDHGVSDKTPGKTRLVWINFDDEGIQEYAVVNHTSKFTQFPDGTALLTGTIERVTDNCFKYIYSVRLINRSDWNSWQNQGKTFKGGPFDDHENWIYYDIDEANSQFYGAGCHIGELLDIIQRPVDKTLGFQVGNGANLKNGSFGLSGWFTIAGDRTGAADFNGNIEDCVEQSAEIRLGDRVWEDLNGNGLQDDGEPGINGVTATLIGKTFNGQGVIQTTSTIDGGRYGFGPLLPGRYKVIFSDVPGGFFATALNQGPDLSIDSDVDPINGMTANKVYGGADDDFGIDAGYFRLADIGNLVWEDLNRNGLREAGEPGIAGVDIQLTGQDGTGEAVNRSGQTDGVGIYFFDGLKPGSYKLTFNKPDGFAATLADQGSDDTIDSDADPITGMTIFEELISGEMNDTYDAGFFKEDILPVDLSAFEAKLVNENEVRLDWTTASELNNSYFTVERSTDGESYLAIGIVEGNGTTDAVNYYNFLDESPFFGRNYYRLKQVDLDGSYEYSDVRLVVVKQEDLPDAIVYPNPTKDFTSIRAVKPFEQDVTIEVLAITGEVLQRIEVSKDMNSQLIDMSDLKAGFYFVNIRYDEFRKVVHRVLKIQD